MDGRLRWTAVAEKVPCDVYEGGCVNGDHEEITTSLLSGDDEDEIWRVCANCYGRFSYDVADVLAECADQVRIQMEGDDE